MWDFCQDCGRHWIDGGNRIVRVGRPRARINDRNTRSLEVPAAFRIRRNGKPLSLSLMSPLPLVIHEEKRLVPLNRSAKARAELVLFVWGSGCRRGIEEVFGIEDIIPDKFEHAAVEAIGAGLCNHIDDPARLTA